MVENVRMRIGIELGWSAVRAVTVTAQGEILSIPDALDSAAIETLPVVARTAGGVLVGKYAMALAGQSIPGLAGDSPRHALAEAARGDPAPLSMLLTKLARDLADYGARADDAVFCVDPDILARLPDRATFGAFGKAAASAGFVGAHYVNRSAAAALFAVRQEHEGGFLPDIAHAGLGQRNPCTLVVDVGFHALRLSSASTPIFEGRPVFQEVAASGWSSDGARNLLSDCYGHFFDLIGREEIFPTQNYRDAFTLASLWGLVTDPKAPNCAVVLDADRKPRVFDVVRCREALAEDVKRHLRAVIQTAQGQGAGAILAQLKQARIEALIVPIGDYASILQVRRAVTSVLNQELRPDGEFECAAPLAQRALSVAVALPTPKSHLSEAAPKDAVDRELANWLQRTPINDGDLCSDGDPANADLPTDSPEDDTAAHTADPLDLLDASFAPEHRLEILKMDVTQLGKLLGSLWAVQVDRLLRRRASAPTVGLKTIYEQELRELGVKDEDVNPATILAAFEAGPNEVNRLQKSIRNRHFDISVAGQNFVQAFSEGFHDFARLDASPFRMYAEQERAKLLPCALALAYNAGGEYDARLPDRSLALRDRLLISSTESGGHNSTSAPPRMTPARALGVSSDGFRPLLASAFVRRPSVSAVRSFLADVSTFAGGRGAVPLMSWAGLVAFVLLLSAAGFPSMSEFLSEHLSRKPEAKFASFSDPGSVSLPCAAEVCKLPLPPAPAPAPETKLKVALPVTSPTGTCYVAVLRVFNPITKPVMMDLAEAQSTFISRDRNLANNNALNASCKLDKSTQLLVPSTTDGPYSVQIFRDLSEFKDDKNKEKEALVKDNTAARNIVLRKGEEPGLVVQELIWSGWDPSTITSEITLPQITYRTSSAAVTGQLVSPSPAPPRCVDQYASLAVIGVSTQEEARAALSRELRHPAKNDATLVRRWLLRPPPPTPPPAQPPKPVFASMGDELGKLRLNADDDAPSIRAVFENAKRFVGECKLAP